MPRAHYCTWGAKARLSGSHSRVTVAQTAEKVQAGYDRTVSAHTLLQMGQQTSQSALAEFVLRQNVPTVDAGASDLYHEEMEEGGEV